MNKSFVANGTNNDFSGTPTLPFWIQPPDYARRRRPSTTDVKEKQAQCQLGMYASLQKALKCPICSCPDP